jgi:hypothetical protein
MSVERQSHRNMKRLLVDLCGFGLLVGAVQLLPTTASIIVGLAIPVTVGFARGYVEQRFLPKIPYWIAMLEWAVVVFAADVMLCIPNSKSDPHENFWTVFGAFFLILIIPSVILSTVSYFVGLLVARSRISTDDL